MQRGAHKNLQYEIWKTFALCILKHHFTTLIRVGGYYYCLQHVSDRQILNAVTERNKPKSPLWFIEKTCMIYRAALLLYNGNSGKTLVLYTGSIKLT